MGSLYIRFQFPLNLGNGSVRCIIFNIPVLFCVRVKKLLECQWKMFWLTNIATVLKAGSQVNLFSISVHSPFFCLCPLTRQEPSPGSRIVNEATCGLGPLCAPGAVGSSLIACWPHFWGSQARQFGLHTLLVLLPSLGWLFSLLSGMFCSGGRRSLSLESSLSRRVHCVCSVQFSKESTHLLSLDQIEPIVLHEWNMQVGS